MKIPVGIVGARGYTAREMIKIFLNHPGVELTSLSARNENPEHISSVFPMFRNLIDLNVETSDIDKISSVTDAVFLALPHKTAQEFASEFIKRGKKVFDLSADFRFVNTDLYEKTYGIPHLAKELNKEAVYALPEINREKIKSARLLACPGCYPTSVILGAAPMMSEDFVDFNSIIADSKSGVSGAGKNPSATTHYHECNESIKPYSVASHRHSPEIEEKLSILSGKDIKLTFTPHLTPMDRGILSIIYINLTKDVDEKTIYAKFKEFYKNKHFIRLLPLGEMPATKNVAHTNFCDIGIKLDVRTHRLIIATVIDNLIKGASGQAVQAFNICMGFDEKSGL